jgi:hypothetical protein
MNIMTLEQLIQDWQTDAKIDQTEPGNELLKNPNLHSKYSEQLARHSLALKGAKQRYSSVYRIRSDYYNGRMSREELEKNGLPPFQFVLKGDVKTYLDADPALHELEKKMFVHEEAITFLTSVIKAINNRSYDLRGYIDWVKYIQGGR